MTPLQLGVDYTGKQEMRQDKSAKTLDFRGKIL
jgi:hypothetical protein